MTNRLRLPEKYRLLLESLFQAHLPGVEVWAYGSRLTSRCRDGSDLDLVLRGPELQEIPVEKLMDFRHAVQESTIPFLVEAHDWSHLPVRFHKRIEKDFVRLV